MWWLTDSPDAFAAAFGIETRPGLVLPAEVGAAWACLAGPAPAFAATDGHGDDRVLVHVARARRSQYDAIRAALAADRALPRRLLSLVGRGSGLRGLRERRWEAAPGNLHLSVLLRESLEIARIGGGLSMLPAVTVADWLDPHLPAGTRAEIKWVNDLLVDRRKIGGVLASSSIRGRLLEDCLFGIGLNLATAPPIEPDVFVTGTTCLAEWVGPPPLRALVDELASGLERRFAALAADGPEALLAAYRHHHRGIGREVRVWLDEPADPLDREPLARGTLEDIHPDLSLRIRGHRQPVTRGRLAYEEDVAAARAARADR